MWKVLLGCLLILSSISICDAMTRDQWLSHHEEKIQEMCDATYVPSPFEGNVFSRPGMFPGEWECELISLYGMHKVLDIMMYTARSTEDWAAFEALMEKHYLEDFDTFNFKGIHQGYESYLESKEEVRK